MKAIVVLDRVAGVLDGMTKLANRRILVGIPAEKTARETGDPVNNAWLGYLHENGSPAANIPARPFLMPGVQDVHDDTIAKFRHAGVLALSGKPIDKALNAIGLHAQASVRHRITVGPFAPLAESTLAARRARGRTGKRPLIDTGQLRDSITYVIRMR